MIKLSLLIVTFAALLIPILMSHFNISNVPTAVAEITVGIILGKSGLNIVHSTFALSFLSSLGVMMLMFLSGLEIDFSLFKKKDAVTTSQTIQSPLPTAMKAFGLVIITTTALGIIIRLLGFFQEAFLAALIFSTIALGVVIPTLKEKQIINQLSGQTLMLAAVLGEVGPMMALTIYASINGGNVQRLWLIIFLFLATIFLLWRFKEPYRWFNKISKATTQLDIRLAFFLIFALVSVAEDVGAENVLGAFLAGIVMKLLEPTTATEGKLNSIGYGFLIPFFFIMTGAKLDLTGFFANLHGLLLLPVLISCFLLAKLPTILIFRRIFSPQNACASGLLLTTTITLVLPTLQVAQNLHTITGNQADAFTLAAVIVCIIGPVGFNSLYRVSRKKAPTKRVVILGTNIATIPVAQQLIKDNYAVRLVTDDDGNYRTFKSGPAPLILLPTLTEQALKKAQLFDTDILLTAFKDNDKNAQLAQLARKNGVPRVIAAQNSLRLTNEQCELLKNQHVEIYNSFVASISILRAIIENPAVAQSLIQSTSGLFEATVRNEKYNGYQLRALPFNGAITISNIYRHHRLIDPTADTTIQLGDRLFFIGPHDEARSAKAALEQGS